MVLGVPKLTVRLGPALAVPANLRVRVALPEGCGDRFPDRRQDFDSGALRSLQSRQPRKLRGPCSARCLQASRVRHGWRPASSAPLAISCSAAAASLRFFDFARLAKAVWASSLEIRSGVASKLMRKGRSTVTLRKPNSRFSKIREMTRVSVSPLMSTPRLSRRPGSCHRRGSGGGFGLR